jgi:hypothetical protein
MVNFYKKYGWMLAKTEIGSKKLMYYNKKKKEQFLISKKYSKLIPF